jgi:hypothetical protein
MDRSVVGGLRRVGRRAPSGLGRVDLNDSSGEQRLRTPATVRAHADDIRSAAVTSTAVLALKHARKSAAAPPRERERMSRRPRRPVWTRLESPTATGTDYCNRCGKRACAADYCNRCGKRACAAGLAVLSRLVEAVA